MACGLRTAWKARQAARGAVFKGINLTPATSLRSMPGQVAADGDFMTMLTRQEVPQEMGMEMEMEVEVIMVAISGTQA